MLNRFIVILFKLIFSDKSPQGLRRTFQDLGPSFVKLGQLLASRPDFVSKEYAEEFRKLLDNEEQVPYPIIEKIIKEELGERIKEFKEINKTPISSASIAQVHIGILKNNRKVALKVKKPQVEEMIYQDTKVISKLVGILTFFSSFFRGINLKRIVFEYSMYTKRELDFIEEGKRAKTLALNLEKYPNFVIPQIYDKLSTENLLVLEYIEGITVNEIMNRMKQEEVSDPQNLKLPFKIDFEKAISDMIECYIFKQILTDGFFHGDPHPANIFLLKDNKVGLVDFGLMVNLDKKEHSQFLMFILGIIENDPDKILKVLASISEKEFDRKEEMDITDALSDELHMIAGGSLRNATMGEMLLDAMSLGKKYNLHWSSGLVLGTRAIALLEGIGLRLVPQKSIIELVKPHLRKYIAHEALSKFSEDEIYKNVLRAMELFQKAESIGDLIGDKGLRVEVAKEGGENNEQN